MVGVTGGENNPFCVQGIEGLNFIPCLESITLKWMVTSYCLVHLTKLFFSLHIIDIGAVLQNYQIIFFWNKTGKLIRCWYCIGLLLLLFPSRTIFRKRIFYWPSLLLFSKVKFHQQVCEHTYYIFLFDCCFFAH